MELKREIKFYAINNVTQATAKDSLYAVKGVNESSFKLYVTDNYGNLIPLFTSQSSGGGITNLTSTDSSILITGSAVKDLKLSTTLQNLINSALQSGDFVSTLVNDAGYITLADLPIFNPSDYDLEDFTNTSTDPFVRQSEVGTGETNLAYTASPINGTVTSDSGSDAIIPLANATNAGLLDSAEKSKIATAIQPIDLGLVATSNDYNDLDNIPTTFTPSAHTHVEADITDLDKYTQLEVDNFLDDKVDKVAGKSLIDDAEITRLSSVTNFDNSGNITALANKVDKIIGKGLSTEDYTTVEKSKLAGIEVGATANDTDVNLKNRVNHTGTQLASTISDFVSQVGTLITNALASFKTANFLDFTSSGQTQLDGKQDNLTWVDYSTLTTTVGWSSFGQKKLWYLDFGTHVLAYYHLSGPGNGVNSSFTLPFTATEESWCMHIVMNNGTYLNYPGRGSIANGSNVVNLFASLPGSTWSAGLSNKIASGFILIKK